MQFITAEDMVLAHEVVSYLQLGVRELGRERAWVISCVIPPHQFCFSRVPYLLENQLFRNTVSESILYLSSNRYPWQETVCSELLTP